MDKNLLRENRIHGDTMFPFSIYTVKPNGDCLFDHHWHNELELIMVREGQTLFQIDTAHFEGSAGEAVFINSRELHAAIPLTNSPCSLYALVFNVNLLSSGNYDTLQNKYIGPLIRKEYAIPSIIKADVGWKKEFLTHLATLINLSLSKPFAYELLVKAHLLTMVALLMSNSQPNSAIPPKTAHKDQIERIKATLEYIHSNYYKKITIAELAARQNICAAHFCRLFKQMVNRTPIDYINNYRIRKAAQLLEEGDQKITFIAMEVGFENPSYFINVFKHYLKVTPSQYLKLQREKLN
jgi:AraC-like DNA-binding protein